MDNKFSFKIKFSNKNIERERDFKKKSSIKRNEGKLKTDEDNELKKDKNKFVNNVKDNNNNHNHNHPKNKFYDHFSNLPKDNRARFGDLKENNKGKNIILNNVGKTSYINCVIRVLTNIEDIQNYFLENIGYEKEMPISSFYSRILFHLFKQSSQNNYSLENFYKILTHYNHVFKGNKTTKDAIDFLIYFIEQLHEENKIINKKSNNHISNKIDFHNYDNYKNYLKENENSIILKTFSWINKKVEKCWECNNEKISFQNFFTFDLDFQNVLNQTIVNNKNQISILDCIKYSSEKKDIYNIFCYNCNKKSNYTKISSIYFSSKYMIFLIRGIENNKLIMKMQNNNIQIKINTSLDLSTIFQNNNSIYNLYGLIFYDLEKSEYIAYSNSPNNIWVKYIDEKIIKVQSNDFMNENFYEVFPVILLYKQMKN